MIIWRPILELSNLFLRERGMGECDHPVFSPRHRLDRKLKVEQYILEELRILLYREAGSHKPYWSSRVSLVRLTCSTSWLGYGTTAWRARASFHC